jgi:hypothetical protein
MTMQVAVDARWDSEARVWFATSAEVPGLVVEAETWPAMIDEVRLVLPDLLALNGQTADGLSVTFRAEERVEVPAA